MLATTAYDALFVSTFAYKFAPNIAGIHHCPDVPDVIDMISTDPAAKPRLMIPTLFVVPSTVLVLLF